MAMTRVGAVQVPVVRAKGVTLVRFRAGEHGAREAGDYLFWTAVLKKRKGSKSRILGRAYAYLAPGDRFDRIKREMRRAKSSADRAAYRRLWLELLSRGENIKHVRPSTLAEVRRWMRTHAADARFALFGLIGGKRLPKGALT
jgi:hypothetical protein